MNLARAIEKQEVSTKPGIGIRGESWEERIIAAKLLREAPGADRSEAHGSTQS